MMLILDGKVIELNETEDCIFDLICDFSIELDEKIKLIFHYQSKIDNSVFSYFLQITDFVEILKKKRYKVDNLEVMESQLSEIIGLMKNDKGYEDIPYTKNVRNWGGIEVKQPAFHEFMNQDALYFAVNHNLSVRIENVIDRYNKRYGKRFKIIEVYYFGSGFRQFGKEMNEEFKGKVNEILRGKSYE